MSSSPTLSTSIDTISIITDDDSIDYRTARSLPSTIMSGDHLESDGASFATAIADTYTDSSCSPERHPNDRYRTPSDDGHFNSRYISTVEYNGELDESNDEEEDDVRTILATSSNGHYRRVSTNSTKSQSSISDSRMSLPGVPISKATSTRSIPQVMANMAKSTLGAGVTGLPYALANTGPILGALLLTLTTLLVAASYTILVIMSRYCGRQGRGTYVGLTEMALGPIGPWLYDIITFIGCLGTDVSYFLIIADTITTVFGQYTSFDLLLHREFIIIIVGVFAILPMILFRHLGSLAHVSLFSFILYPFILVAIGVRAPVYAVSLNVQKQVSNGGNLFIGPNVWSGVAIMALAMQAQQTTFMHYSSLKRPTQSRWSITVLGAMLISFLVSLGFALIGYLAFGQNTTVNIFNNFPADDLVVNIARICMAFTLVFSYPMMFFPARDAFHGLISKFKALFRISQESESETYYAMSASRKYLLSITIPLWIITIIISLSVHDLGRVFQFIGALSSVSIAFLIPASCFISLFYVRRQKPLLWDEGAQITDQMPREDSDEEDEDYEISISLDKKSAEINSSTSPSSSTSLLPKRSRRRIQVGSSRSSLEDNNAIIIDPLLVMKEQELQRRAIGKRWWMDAAVFIGFIPGGVICLLVGMYSAFR